MAISVFEIFGGDLLSRALRLGGFACPVTICGAAAVLPATKLLELLFFAHERLLIAACLVGVSGEGLSLIRGGWPPRPRDLLHHSTWTVILILFALLSMPMTEWIAGARLVRLEVVTPLPNDAVGLRADVGLAIRHLEGRWIYLIVESPEGTLWVQQHIPTPSFERALRGQVQLGDGSAGVGRRFSVFAVATKEELPAPSVTLKTTRPDWTVSNVVEVLRTR